MLHYKETKYGFEYGNAKVSRLFSDEKKGWITLRIESDKHQGHNAIQVYVTKTGKIRIHSKGEWLPYNAKEQADSVDKNITGVCKCGEELYIETVDGESFITCR